MRSEASLALFLGGIVARAAQSAYGQCGGINWTGDTTCTPGYNCVVQNPYYSQCVPAPNDPGSQGPYQQCGGINWTGGTSCTTGWTCVVQNPYYSQCLPASASTPVNNPTTASSASVASSTKVVTTTTAAATTTVVPTTTNNKVSTTTTISKVSTTTNSKLSTTTTTKISSSSSSTSINKASSSSASTAGSSIAASSSGTSAASAGPTYKASMTHYGAGDSFGSPNCNTNTAACGFYTYPGYSAAISQNFYGAGPGAGAGPACGTCWRLTGQTDSSGQPLTNAGTTIVVMVNNLCPADGNPLCAQNGKDGTNQYGANVNFDLCSDSGAQAAFFGNDGVGLAIGTATQVDCSQWSGTVVH